MTMKDLFATNIRLDRRAIAEKLQMEGLPIVIREDAVDIWGKPLPGFLAIYADNPKIDVFDIIHVLAKAFHQELYSHS
jgi:hypothetical protein